MGTFIIVCAGIIIYKSTSLLAQYYLGAAIVIRFPSFIRGAVLTGLVLIVIREFWGPNLHKKKIQLVIWVIGFSLASSIVTKTINAPKPKWHTAEQIERGIYQKIDLSPEGQRQFTEKELYFAMACEVDGVCDLLDKMIPSSLPNNSR